MKQWERFCSWYSWYENIGLGVDLSRVGFSQEWWDCMQRPIQKAFDEMEALEAGAIANPDEQRMVGHYWLRAPERAPSQQIAQAIQQAIQDVQEFAQAVHSGKQQGAQGPFTQFVLIGIGGSALGPQFLTHALSQPKRDKLRAFFVDNTDPDGIDRVLEQLDGSLGKTLCLIISKSGGTPETRNGMIRFRQAYEQAGLSFPRHAVAITQPGSKLDRLATEEKWLARFPIWEWVGGRTSATSAVGLLPLALLGVEIEQFLRGARDCDQQTRLRDPRQNPAAQLALMWYFLGDGRGAKDMVILPYKDRLELFARYLQQLVMESLGKKHARDGRIVYQGLTVYGNKGSTDQHAYIQQLRDGLRNFFVVFIEVLQETWHQPVEIEPGLTAGDYLHGFLLGTRQALFEADRPSITVTIRDVSPYSLGVLIAVFERAVGLYASLIDINAYHQPGVEAGKKAAAAVLELQKQLVHFLQTHSSQAGFTVEEIAQGIGRPEERETIFKLCERLAVNGRYGIQKGGGVGPLEARYRIPST